MGRFSVQPRLWHDQTIAVIGGGPSLKDFDLTPLHRAGIPTITTNNAYLLAPWSQVHFFGDSRWWRWHGDALDTSARRVVTAGGAETAPGVQRVRKEYDIPLATRPDAVAGPDSGSMAINLAYHYGASRVLLFGMDMRFAGGEAHWHEDHPIPTPEKHYVDIFAPHYAHLHRALLDRDVQVLRCTPSALTHIPEIEMSQALALAPRPRRNPLRD